MWRSNRKLIDLNGCDYLKTGHCFENFIGFGDTGAGKTSGPIQTVTRSFLGNDFGGLFLCVKSTAAADYMRWTADSKRQDDLIHFGIGKGHAFNFLEFLSNRAGDKTQAIDDLVHVLVETMEVVERERSVQDPFFRPWSRLLITACLRILIFVHGRIDLHQLSQMLSSLPREGNELRTGASFCAKTLKSAWEKSKGTLDEDQIEVTVRFFGTDWAQWAIETRESIRATAQMVITEISSEPLLTLFGKSTTVSPADILEGKLVVVDIPVLLSERTGKIANTIWRTSLQRAILARPIPPHEKVDALRPVFILGDEAQYLVTSGDELFVSSSREHRGITFYATQTINSLINVIGKPATMSLLGGLLNVFMNRTKDADTANWFRDSMNQVVNYGRKEGPVEWVVNDFSTEVLRSLKKGGPDRKVECIFNRANDEFDVNGLRWCRVSFRQNHVVPKNAVQKAIRLLISNDARVLEGETND